MGCCIAAALIISLVRRAWFGVFPGRRPVVISFAPPARRPAPGTSVLEPQTLTAPPRSGPSPAIAATVALYVSAIAVLGMTGAAPDLSDPLIPWFARDVLLAAVFGVALVRAYGCSVRDLPRFLAVAGATWTALAIIDMHLFELFTLSTSADILVHGGGFLVLCIGLAARKPATSLLSIPDTEGALL